ncbi:hypothetical protein TcCL_ESM05942 [Trypanosoma cruzi]|nr:hypothetical protein TcCL_ESM05942 [Trypanosoma cruzi]
MGWGDAGSELFVNLFRVVFCLGRENCGHSAGVRLPSWFFAQRSPPPSFFFSCGRGGGECVTLWPTRCWGPLLLCVRACLRVVGAGTGHRPPPSPEHTRPKQVKEMTTGVFTWPSPQLRHNPHSDFASEGGCLRRAGGECHRETVHRVLKMARTHPFINVTLSPIS